MTARPILMSGAMVRSLLAGTKTQTRRIVKGVALDWLDGVGFDPAFLTHPGNDVCPYGRPGDLLWVRETWGAGTRPCSFSGWVDGIEYRADCEGDEPPPLHPIIPEHVEADSIRAGWRPWIHMPRWASRLTLELTEVRVERKQAISAEHAIAEGIEPVFNGSGERCGWLNYLYSGDGTGHFTDPRDSYASLTDFINGPGSWDANQWLWVLSFRVHQQNVDALLKERAA